MLDDWRTLSQTDLESDSMSTRDGPMSKFHYSAEAENLMNATEAEASAEYFLPSLYLLVSKVLLNKSSILIDMLMLVSYGISSAHDSDMTHGLKT